jgi:hypothetical protein
MWALTSLSSRRAAVTVALLLLAVPAWAYDLPEWRATLKGIKVLRVEVIVDHVCVSMGVQKDQF